MEEKTIRATLNSLTDEIRQLDERREKLMTARSGLEALLSLQATAGNGSTPPMFDMPTVRGKTKPKGIVSLRQAVIRTMKESKGKALHTSEILRRANAIGATTEAKDPFGVTDLMLYSLKRDGNPVEKTAPRTWRWTGRQ